jgi:hypothetical protein
VSASEEYPLCVRCGAPVRINRNRYDLFEKMHYLCFHLEFEHGDYDPDEFCHVPGCHRQSTDWDPTAEYVPKSDSITPRV